MRSLLASYEAFHYIFTCLQNRYLCKRRRDYTPQTIPCLDRDHEGLCGAPFTTPRPNTENKLHAINFSLFWPSVPMHIWSRHSMVIPGCHHTIGWSFGNLTIQFSGFAQFEG